MILVTRTLVKLCLYHQLVHKTLTECLIHKHFEGSKLSTELGAMLDFLAIVKKEKTKEHQIVENKAFENQ